MDHILKTYNYHQQFNNWGTGFPLQWINKRKTWQYLEFSDANINFRIHITITFLIRILLISLAIIVIHTALRAPNHFEYYHILSQLVVILVLLVTFAIDYIIVAHGPMLAFSCNWAYDVAKLHKISKHHAQFIFKTVTTPLILLVPSTYISVALYIYSNLDTCHSFAICLRYYLPQYFKTLGHFEYVFLKILNYTVSLWMTRMVVTGSINLTLLGISVCVS